MDQQLQSLSRQLHPFCLGRRVHQITRTPEMTADQGQTVRKGRLGFAIPGRHCGVSADRLYGFGHIIVQNSEDRELVADLTSALC
jgi:hypothetical protein